MSWILVLILLMGFTACLIGWYAFAGLEWLEARLRERL